MSAFELQFLRQRINPAKLVGIMTERAPRIGNRG
jgi:hypothetical protein